MGLALEELFYLFSVTIIITFALSSRMHDHEMNRKDKSSYQLILYRFTFCQESISVIHGI